MDNPFVLPEGFHPSHEDPVVLPENQARVLFFLNALLGVASPMDGPAVHQLMRECLDASFTSTEDLVEWLSVRIPVQRPSRRAVDRCIEGTDRLLERGAWAAEWKGVPPFDACRPSCPRCMFGVGPPSKDQPRLGVFNSRKSRLVSPDEPWISALRFSLPLLLRPEDAGAAVARSTFPPRGTCRNHGFRRKTPESGFLFRFHVFHSCNALQQKVEDVLQRPPDGIFNGYSLDSRDPLQGQPCRYTEHTAGVVAPGAMDTRTMPRKGLRPGEPASPESIPAINDAHTRQIHYPRKSTQRVVRPALLFHP